mgnify:CR=1 FL=1|tara:strand:- start:264 stop:851 length:588 start_codon:yes stop_codon:yes gene_type:complete
MSNATKIFESWRRYLGEAPFAATRRANVRGAPMRATQVATSVEKPVKQIAQRNLKQIAQKNQLPALRTKGEIQPVSKQFKNELVKVTKQYLQTIPKDLESPGDDAVDYIMGIVEKTCEYQNLSPLEFQKFSGDLRSTLEQNRQDPKVLLSVFKQTLDKIIQQGGFDVDCDQITTQNNKQITQRENNEKIRSKKSN